MKRLNILETILEWIKHRIVDVLPDSIKRLVLYELCERVASIRRQEGLDEWSVTFGQMYDTLED